MLKRAAALLVATLAAVPVVVSAADDISLTIQNGRVTVTARDAAISDVLQAWSRAGGTTIVNGDQLRGTRVTVQLVDVPEEQALDVILRQTGGYIARKRATPVTSGSGFDRVVIMARSSAVTSPAGSSAPAAALAAQPSVVEPEPQPAGGPAEPQGVERLIGPDGLPVPDDQDGVPPPPPPMPRGFSFGDEPSDDPRTQPPSSPAAPVKGAAVPGMIVPAPQPGAPQPQR
jgi:hypothetical protein